MATRMQQRRGSAAQWVSTHDGDGPILNAGEIGFETDTGKFKIGDGINHWVDLNYFLDEYEIDNITGDYVLSSTLGQNNGVATLDGSGKLTSSQIPDIDEISQDAINTALVAGTGLDKTYDDNANTITLDIDSTVATKSFAAELLTNATKTNIVISGDENGLTITAENGVADSTTDNLVEGTTNKYFTDQRALDATASAYDTAGSAAAAQTAAENYADGLAVNYDAAGSANTAVSNHNSETTSVHGIADTSKIVLTDSETTTLDGDLVVDGDFTVNGTNFSASATSIVIEDNIVQLAHQNPANTVDLGIVVGYNDGTAKHAGLVKDTSASTWKLFKDVTTEPTTTVDFTEGSLDDLAVAGLTASSITVGDVSNTEFGYLNGVTSSIQTQLDDKLSSTNPGLIAVNSSSNALEIRQTGAGNALVVEDSTNPDVSPFVIDANGAVISGHTSWVNVGLNTDGFENHVNSGTEYGGLNLINWRNNIAMSSALHFAKANSNVIGTQAAVTAGTDLGRIGFYGSDGTDFVASSLILAEADGTISTGVVGGRLNFSTANPVTGTLTERIRIDAYGGLTLGGSPSSNVALYVRRPTSETPGNATQYGTYILQTLDSATTTAYYGVRVLPTTDAASFTLADYFAFRSDPVTIGAGSAVNESWGFYVPSTFTTATTNNFGFASAIPASTGRWNAYMLGTAANYFAGQTTVGSTSLTLGSGSVAQQFGVVSTAASNVGAVIRGAASQTANLTEWQNSTGGVIANITPVGGLYVSSNITQSSAGRTFIGGTGDHSAFLNVSIPTASRPGIVIRSNASQTANIQEWQNGSGTVLASINASGQFVGDGSQLTGISAGADEIMILMGAL